MAVISVDFKKLEKMCGHSEKKIIDCLTNIGMPVEPGEDGGLVVEVTPNRPDLFCIEGISRAVRSYYEGFLPEYGAKKSDYVLSVSPKTAKVRPAICAAVVRGLKLDDELLLDLMQMQEKLHDTVGRKRKKLAVGIHDLDKISGKMEYVVASDEKFVPLELTEEMDVWGVLKKHPKGIAFAHLVEKEAVVIRDGEGIISFPPIINSERTRVTTETKNLLIESTGTSVDGVEKAVNIIATALADRGGEVYVVKVGDRNYPDFSYSMVKINLKEANRVLGLELSEKEAEAALRRMGVGVKNGSALVPPYRADVISFTDILEDIAIGHGYEKLEPTLPMISTVGGGSEEEEPIHDTLTGMGFMEIKNYILTNMEKLEATGRGRGALAIKNSASEEFTYLRTSLIPGILGCFSTNKMKGLPQMYYEFGEVYNEREYKSLCFGLMGEGVSITDLQPHLQTLVKELGGELGLKEIEDVCFIKGRCAKILVGGKEIGVIGSVHPEVLQRFGLEHAVVVCEVKKSGLF
jgi:phenylalanyl-tRNA synthetase beta chain